MPRYKARYRLFEMRHHDIIYFTFVHLAMKLIVAQILKKEKSF